MSIDLNSLPEDLRQKIINLQNLQQTLEFLTSQKIQIDTSLRENELAIDELEKSDENINVYKSIGGILVKSEKNKLLAEKKSTKTTLEMRSKTIAQKQERTKQQIDTMRKSLQADLQSQQA